jgi:hypothetical protein
MLEISKYFVDQMKDDNTLSTLLGSDDNDSRIYSYDPPFTITFSPTYKAAIFYQDNQNPRPTEYSYPSQRGNIYYYLSIESPNKNLAKQIGEYLVSMFENKGFVTTNWRVCIVVMNGTSEGVVGGTTITPIYKQNLSFLLKEVLKRTNIYS